MSVKFERIALFLNMVSRKLCVGAGRTLQLDWIDSTTSLASSPVCDCTETQVLVANDGLHAFWIANNEDTATDAQKAYLEKLGINTFAKLSDHVDSFEERLQAKLKKPSPTGKGSKVLLFWNMVDAGKAAKATSITPTLISAPPMWRHSLGLAGAMPMIIPSSMTVSETTNKDVQAFGAIKNAFTFVPFTFIVDEYDYTAGKGTRRHAEQKLLAAFAKLDKTVIMGMQISIHGCKAPCSRCAVVLDNARTYLKRFDCTLKLDNQFAELPRTLSGFTPREVDSTTAELDDKYYPRGG